MNELGLAAPFWLVVAIWMAKTVLLAFICTFLAWLGIRVLDALNPHIHKRQRIGESPLATGLFAGGFLILVGLVIPGPECPAFVVTGETFIVNHKLLVNTCADIK